MTVRQRIDQLAAEPPVRDLGYVADQRLVASALLGLQLLADEIDALKAENENAEIRRPPPFEPIGMHIVEDHTDLGDAGLDDDELDDDELEDGADMQDIVDQLAELTKQVKKLTKAVGRSADGARIATDTPSPGGKAKKQKRSKK